ncbi:MAG: DUF4375 domain-containing protein [Oscillospiraceae bacterium]|nr:DUF4375 domain-containing protein [Oscillospiraceae bacterium]
MKLFEAFSKKSRSASAARKEAAAKQRTVADTYTELRKLSRCGSNMDALTAAQRTFYIVQSYEAEVMSGGHSRYFVNSAADFAAELPAALRTVGAHDTANRFAALLSSLLLPPPAEQEKRQKWFETLFCGRECPELHARQAQLQELDDFVMRREENLDLLCYDYVLQQYGSTPHNLDPLVDGKFTR